MAAARARRGRSAAQGEGVGEKLSRYLAGTAVAAGKPGRTTGGVLVDTGAWIEYFRVGETAVSRTLDGLLRGERVWTCGPVLLELLQGVRSEGDRAAVMGALGSLEYLELGPQIWVRAAGLASALRGRGRQVPHSDLLIAALALEHKLHVLTADRHFEEIPGLALFAVAPGGGAAAS